MTVGYATYFDRRGNRLTLCLFGTEALVHFPTPKTHGTHVAGQSPPNLGFKIVKITKDIELIVDAFQIKARFETALQ